MSPYAEAMQLAVHEARLALEHDDVPVGAVLLASDGAVLSRAHNEREGSGDPTAHAEVLAIRRAAEITGSWRLEGCTLVVTLEPCPMCAHAISLFRIRRLVFGAYDPKGGGVDHGVRMFDSRSCHHRPEVIGGIRETASTALLRDFFRAKRQ